MTMRREDERVEGLPTFDRSAFYTVEDVGRTRRKTPEGFLVLEAVPVARTGEMLYSVDDLKGEIESTPGSTLVIVTRTAEDLFRPETLASFEGKPVTNDHPDDMLGPVNYRDFMVGVMQNVRRGAGVQEDLMLADLLIMDEQTIKDIEKNGKVQVSNGYEADYEQLAPGRARQFNIIGNHVALVDNGRCGPRCAIGDSAMATKTAQPPKKVTIFDRIAAAFVTKDEKALLEMKDELVQMEEGSGSTTSTELPGQPNGINVHVHLGEKAPASTGEAATKDELLGEGTEEPVKQVDETLGEHEKNDADRFARLEALVAQIAEKVLGGGGAATTDGEEEEEQEVLTEDEAAIAEELGEVKDAAMCSTKDKKTVAVKDSASLQGSFQQLMSQAEILSPGHKLITFDAKHDPELTQKRMCGFRRTVLKKAATADATKGCVAQVLNGADLKTMTCDAVTAAFNAAVALQGERNRAKSSHVHMGRLTTHDGAKQQGPTTIAELNAFHAKHWDRNSTVKH